MGSLNSCAGPGHLWWGVLGCPPGQGLFCATSSPWQSFSGRNGATKSCPSAMPSLTVQCLCQKSESSCHIALIKWAKDCYHRVMGSCWSINVGAKLEAVMETMWKAWYLFSEQGSAGPFSSCSPIMSLFLFKWGEYLSNRFLCWMVAQGKNRCSWIQHSK